MESLLKKHETKLRFLLVGGTNTLIDFALLFILTALGVNKIVANIISTGIAFIFSFFANRQFTFKDSNKNVKRQFLYFTVITLFGLWIIQPLVILFVTNILSSTSLNDQLTLFIGKVIATVVSLIWNYLFYSKLIFKKSGESN